MADCEPPDMEVLLEMDGIEFHSPCGHSWQISARRVEVSEHRPYGVKYSLTIHDQTGKRIFGMDNAHPVPRKQRGGTGDQFSARIVEYDHFHEGRRVKPYRFESPEKLLADFFAKVDEIFDQKRR